MFDGDENGRILELVERSAGYPGPRQDPRKDRLPGGWQPWRRRAGWGGVSELRIHHGPGYRVYIFQRGDKVVILLCGGDKTTQEADIARAKQLAEQYR